MLDQEPQGFLGVVGDILTDREAMHRDAIIRNGQLADRVTPDHAPAQRIKSSVQSEDPFIGASMKDQPYLSLSGDFAVLGQLHVDNCRSLLRDVGDDEDVVALRVFLEICRPQRKGLP